MGQRQRKVPLEARVLSDSLSQINNGRILSKQDASVDGIIDPGTYLVSDAVGLPSGAYNYGILIVFRLPAALTVAQVYVTDAAVPRTYIRVRWNGAAWRNWCLLQTAA